MPISPNGGSWEKSLGNDAIWKGSKSFCPARGVRHLDKHSSIDSLSKSGSVGRSIKRSINCFRQLNKFRFAVSGDLNTWRDINALICFTSIRSKLGLVDVAMACFGSTFFSLGILHFCGILVHIKAKKSTWWQYPSTPATHKHLPDVEQSTRLILASRLCEGSLFFIER